MAEHLLSGMSINAPVASEAIQSLAYRHGFLTKPFNGTDPVTTFDTGAQDWSNLIQGAFPLERTREATEITLLNGQTLLGDAPVTVAAQTVRTLARLGSDAYAIIKNYDYSSEGAPNSGEWMAFARTYPDGNALIGETRIESHTPEGDPEADAFGYDVTFAFRNVTFWDARTSAGTAPTYASGTGTAADGAPQTLTGTNMGVVTAVQFREADGDLIASTSDFDVQNDTTLTFNTPVLPAGAYTRRLVYSGGEVAAGTFTAP